MKKVEIFFVQIFILVALCLFFMLGIFLSIFNNAWYILISIPFSICIVSFFYRCYNYLAFLLNLNFACSIYENSKKEIKNKIKKDAEIIFKSQATQVFSPFGTGKTFYIQTLVVKYLAYKYGTLSLHFNIWWVKRKNNLSNNILSSKVSFGVNGSWKNFGVSINNDGKTSGLIYCAAFLFMFINLIINFIIWLFAYFWTWTLYFYKTLIIIDDPDRGGQENEYLASFANEKLVKGHTYIILHSNQLLYMDKFVNDRIILPKNLFENINLRIYNKVCNSFSKNDFFEKLKNKDFTKDFKNTMYKKWLLYHSIREQNKKHENLLNNLLIIKGLKINDFLWKEDKKSFLHPNFLGNNQNFFIWRYDLEKIFIALKNDLLSAEMTSIKKFVDTYKYKMNIYKSSLYYDSNYDFEEIIQWILKETIEFEWSEKLPWKNDIDDYSFVKKIIEEGKKQIFNPEIKQIIWTIEIYSYLKRISFNDKKLSTIFSKSQDKQINNNIIKLLSNFKVNNGKDITKFVLIKIKNHKENIFEANQLLNQFFLSICKETLSLSDFESNSISFIEDYEITELIYQINQADYLDQYKVLYKIASEKARIINNDKKTIERVHIIFKNIEIKKPKKQSPQRDYYFPMLYKYQQKIISNFGNKDFNLKTIYKESFAQN